MSLLKDCLSHHGSSEGIIDGLWRGAMKCIGPTAQDADLWRLIWEEVHRTREEGTLPEVEHVKVHRSQKEKNKMTLFEQIVT